MIESDIYNLLKYEDVDMAKYNKDPKETKKINSLASHYLLGHIYAKKREIENLNKELKLLIKLRESYKNRLTDED